MIFQQVEARYVVPEMKHVFSLGDIQGLQRNIGPERDMICLRGFTSNGIEAWSTIDTTKYPIYDSESTVEAWALLKELGGKFVGKDFVNPREAVISLGYLISHHMFQASFANLFLDALAIEQNVPLYSLLGGKKLAVEVGVSVPKNMTMQQIEDRIVIDKFRRIMIKVSPNREDYRKIADIRKQFPDVLLMIDANSSFDLSDTEHVQILYDYGLLNLLMIEQPLAHDDIVNHITLQSMFIDSEVPGKICLDESIHTMEDLVFAVDGGIPIINIKVSRVGGLDIARQMIEYCQEHHVDTWIGGTVELTSPGKAHSLAMASHPGVTLPSDISGTAAYFKEGQDPCKTPMVRDTEGAFIKVPQIAGRGWDVDLQKMDQITREIVVFKA